MEIVNVKPLLEGLNQGMPQRIIIYSSMSLAGDWTDDRASGGHIVITNGVQRTGTRYDYRRDGAVYRIRHGNVQGSFAPEMALNYQSLGICLIGIPRHPLQTPGLPASSKYFTGNSLKIQWISERQAISLVEVLVHLCEIYGFSPLAKKHTVRQKLLEGARFSECGLNIKLIREEVALRMALSVAAR